MSRKPINVEMAGLKTPRERMWQGVRSLSVITPMAVQEAMPTPFTSIDAIQKYLQSLAAGGYIVALAPQGRTAARFAELQYKLVKNSFEAPRITADGTKVQQGLGTLAMWRAMKALKEFDYQDIQRAASVGTFVVTALTAKKYVQLLARAGYYRTIAAAKPGTPARYRLARDTGAHAPAITRRKCVFDRNTGQFTWEQPAQEVCDGLE